MITIGMNYTVLDGKEGVFERAFQAVLDAMKDDAGHRASQLFRDVGDRKKYLIISEWESKEAFDRFVRSDVFARVTNWGREEVLAERPRHRLYREEVATGGWRSRGEALTNALPASPPAE
jgi:heme-degrading monooxygenase HmoA